MQLSCAVRDPKMRKGTITEICYEASTVPRLCEVLVVRWCCICMNVEECESPLLPLPARDRRRPLRLGMKNDLPVEIPNHNKESSELVYTIMMRVCGSARKSII